MSSFEQQNNSNVNLSIDHQLIEEGGLYISHLLLKELLGQLLYWKMRLACAEICKEREVGVRLRQPDPLTSLCQCWTHFVQLCNTSLCETRTSTSNRYNYTTEHTSQEGSGRRVVTLRILLMNGPRRRSADRWPSRSPTWTKAPPQTWFRLCLTFHPISHQYPIKSWEVASEENSSCLIPCFPSALSLFTRSSQCFAFYKSLIEFVYW